MIIVFYTLLHLVEKSRKLFISFYQQSLINFGSDHLEVKKTQHTSKELIITASSITKINTPVDVLRHIKQRLSDEGKLPEDARKIIDEYIDEEEKYNSTIIRCKKGWKPKPIPHTPEQLKTLKLTNQKMTEYELFCKELGPHPTLDQKKEKEKLSDEINELMRQLFTKKSQKN